MPYRDATMGHGTVRRRGPARDAPGRIVLTSLAVALLVSACGAESNAGLAGMVREPLPDVSAVTLPDEATGGQPFRLTAPEGGLLMVYFGYTACPDICPTTLADLRRAVQGLGDDAGRIEVAMITVDPFRDTAEILTSYMQAFFPEGHALRTDDQVALDGAAKAFGAAYEVRMTAEGEIEVSHTAVMSVVDSSGHILVQWPFGMTAEDMQSDIEFLFERGV